MQDIARLMRKLIKLTRKFTVEMRETLGKLLQAFWALQAQLARLETLMHRQICPPIVVFRDAFNMVRAFPYDLSRDWTTFQGLVAVAFTGRQGLHRVNVGQYFVTNTRIARRLNPDFWSNAIQPGDELSMTMILDDVEADEGFCPYKSCGASTADVRETEGGKICPNCFRYAAVSKRHENSIKKIIGSQELDPVIGTDHLGLAGGDGMIEISSLRLTSPLPMPSVGGEDGEDIDLYCSIQVMQTLEAGDHGTDHRPAPAFGSDLSGQPASKSPETDQKISINFQIVSNKSKERALHLLVDTSELVARVMNQALYVEGISPQGQRLVHAGRTLDDEKAIRDYKVRSGDTIYVVPSPGRFNILVERLRNPFGPVAFDIPVWRTETMSDLIRKFKTLGIPRGHYRLTFQESASTRARVSARGFGWELFLHGHPPCSQIIFNRIQLGRLQRGVLPIIDLPGGVSAA